MEVFDRGAAVLAIDEIRDPLHGPGAIERDHSDDVLEDGRLELLQVALHARRFELEDPGRVGILEELEGEFIIEREFVEDIGDEGGLGVKADALTQSRHLAEGSDDTQGVLHDGEVLEPQEVHLKEADLLHGAEFGRGGVLGDDALAAA